LNNKTNINLLDTHQLGTWDWDHRVAPPKLPVFRELISKQYMSNYYPEYLCKFFQLNIRSCDRTSIYQFLSIYILGVKLDSFLRFPWIETSTHTFYRVPICSKIHFTFLNCIIFLFEFILYPNQFQWIIF